MNKQARRKIEMGDRVIALGSNPEIEPTPLITALFTRANDLVGELKERSSDQVAGKSSFRAGSLECRRLVREIRSAMMEISQIARVLKPAELPGAAEIFRMPGNLSFQGLLAAARHFADDAKPHRHLFTSRAMPPDFVEKLEALIGTFELATANKARGRATGIEGTSGMEATGKSLLTVVQELRAILRVHLKGKPALLEAWKSAARVEHDPRIPASRRSALTGTADSSVVADLQSGSAPKGQVLPASEKTSEPNSIIETSPRATSWAATSSTKDVQLPSNASAPLRRRI